MNSEHLTPLEVRIISVIVSLWQCPLPKHLLAKPHYLTPPPPFPPALHLKGCGHGLATSCLNFVNSALSCEGEGKRDRGTGAHLSLDTRRPLAIASSGPRLESPQFPSEERGARSAAKRSKRCHVGARCPASPASVALWPVARFSLFPSHLRKRFGSLSGWPRRGCPPHRRSTGADRRPETVCGAARPCGPAGVRNLLCRWEKGPPQRQLTVDSSVTKRLFAARPPSAQHSIPDSANG